MVACYSNYFCPLTSAFNPRFQFDVGNWHCIHTVCIFREEFKSSFVIVYTLSDCREAEIMKMGSKWLSEVVSVVVLVQVGASNQEIPLGQQILQSCYIDVHIETCSQSVLSSE